MVCLCVLSASQPLLRLRGVCGVVSAVSPSDPSMKTCYHKKGKNLLKRAAGLRRQLVVEQAVREQAVLREEVRLGPNQLL